MKSNTAETITLYDIAWFIGQNRVEDARWVLRKYMQQNPVREKTFPAGRSSTHDVQQETGSVGTDGKTTLAHKAGCSREKLTNSLAHDERLGSEMPVVSR